MPNEERERCVVSVDSHHGLSKALGHVSCDTRWDERAQRIQYKCAALPFSNGEWFHYTDTCQVGLRALIMENCLTLVGDSRFKQAKFPVGEFDKMLAYVSQLNKIDPFQQYLEALPPWDAKPRLDRLLGECFDVMGDHPPEYLAYCSMLPWATAVKRAYEPGCKADTILVIVGDEHSGKSTYVQHMLSPEQAVRWYNGGFSWSGRSMDPKRLATEHTLGKVIVEMGEMSGLRHGEHEELKQYLTGQVDTVVFKYDKYLTDVPRRFVFVGTANDTGEGILRADSGHQRRFAVIKVYNAIGSGYDRVTTYLHENREQIWAEALAVYKAGYLDLHLHDTSTLQHMTAQAREVEQHNPWRDEVENLVSKYVYPRAWTTRDIIKELEWSTGIMQDRAISTHLRQKGYQKKRKRHKRDTNKNTVSAYIPPGQDATDAVWWYEKPPHWEPYVKENDRNNFVPTNEPQHLEW